jgi:hypothetical protein
MDHHKPWGGTMGNLIRNLPLANLLIQYVCTVRIYAACDSTVQLLFPAPPASLRQERGHRVNNDFKIFKVRPSPTVHFGPRLTILHITPYSLTNRFV